MNNDTAQYIAAASQLKAAELELERLSRNAKQALGAFKRTASPMGLQALFPGLKLNKQVGK
jgi:hypothetical protein